MKRFLSYASTIFGVTVLLTILIEVALQCKYSTSTDIRQNWHVLDQKGATILIAGNSRAVTHCNTKIIEDSCSDASIIGSPGWGSTLILHKTESFFDSQPQKKPEILLYVADPIMFGKRRTDWYAKTIHLKYLLGDTHGLYRLNKELQGASILDVFLPLYRYFGDPLRLTRDFLGIKDSREEYNGFVPKDGSWTGPFNFNGGDWPTDSTLLWNTMKKLDQIGDENDIQVVLFEPPFSGPTINATRSTRELLNHQDILPFWSWNNTNKLGSDSTLFRNHSHLNQRGATLFSNQLADSIRFFLGNEKANALQQP